MADTPNNISKLLAALLSEAQVLENIMQDMLTLRTLDTAVGAQLDVIGRIVGQERGGMADVDYRRYCRVRILAHRSNGTAPEVLKIITLLINDITATLLLHPPGIAAYAVEVDNLAIAASLANVIVSFLRDATSAGVRPVLETGASAPGVWFQWDTVGQGWDQGYFLDARDPAHMTP